VLADVARAHPNRVVWLQETSAARAQLELLNGFDANLREDANRLTNRIRGLLATFWPAFERALDDRLDTIAGTVLLKHYPSAPQLRRAGARRVVKLLRATHRVHEPELWVDKLVVAAKSQTVIVAGADTAAELVAELADQLYRILERRQRLEKEIERAFFALPEASILKSLPGIGPRLGARILIEIGDIRQFRTSAQLAAYAGLGPTPHQSGTSIRGNRPTRFGNHRLKNAFFLAALSSLQHAPSRTYYDRKREQGKRHTQALLCLARRRVDVLHAMLSHQVPYKDPASTPTARVA
jgi:transposase